jgi:hypothetical protein
LETDVFDPFKRKANDAGVLPVPPSGLEKISVVLAQEQCLNNSIFLQYIHAARGESGWLDLPQIAATGEANTFRVQGKAFLPIYPNDGLSLDFNLNIPVLRASIGSVINREDFLYLIAFTCEVGAEQDPDLGKLAFSYRDVDDATQEVQIKQMVGENSHRQRVFFIAILSPEPITQELFKGLTDIPQNGDIPAHNRFTVTRKGSIGFPIADYQVWAIDDNWMESKSYELFPDHVDILPICKIRRKANYSEGGYSGGDGIDIIDLILDGTISSEDINTIAWKRLVDLFSGFSKNYSRTVQNLALGSISGNPSPGEPAIASNGTNMIANGQRVSFLDQAITDNLSVIKVRAENDGTDRALITISLKQSTPFGTYFSEHLIEHRIYSVDGKDESALGRFTRLGHSGVLAWIANDNSSIKPGNIAYCVPAICYPPGCGFRIPFRRCEKVWFQGRELLPENIWEGGMDEKIIPGYQPPAGGQRVIAVMARERSGLLYIYEDVVVQSTPSGLVVVPDEPGACFAFVEGVAGRIDAPVVKVPRANTPYRALVYRAPQPGDNWQFLFAYSKYQGLAEKEILDGAEIISEPIFIAHSQGGGNAVYRGEATFRFSPIAKHLPQASASRAPELYGPIHLASEPYPGPLTMRELPIQPAAGLALPMLGQTINWINNPIPAIVGDRTIEGKLLINGEVMGFRLPNLSHDFLFQGVVAFVIKKGKEVRLLIITHDNIGGTAIACDTSAGTAFDLFRMV